MANRVLVSWSSGKDAAWALETLRGEEEVDLNGLLTSVAIDDGRVGMHGTPREVLEAQAEALGLPLLTVELPWPSSNKIYEDSMRSAYRRAAADGVTHIAFGDLFLADVRKYRESLVAGTGLEPLFPLWGRSTGTLAAEMIAGGLAARVTTIDLSKLPAELAGADYDSLFVEALADDVDSCGENGEFHTVVYDLPGFSEPIALSGTCRADDIDGQSMSGFAFWRPSLIR